MAGPGVFAGRKPPGKISGRREWAVKARDSRSDDSTDRMTAGRASEKKGEGLMRDGYGNHEQSSGARRGDGL